MIIIITNNDNIYSEHFNEVLKACDDSRIYMAKVNQDKAYSIVCVAFDRYSEEFEDFGTTD
jgi:hypothetical protein